MNKKQSYLFTLLILGMLFALLGCAGQSASSPAEPDDSGGPSQVQGEPTGQPQDAEEPPEVPEEPAPPPEPTVSTLVVCGDVMSHMPVTNDAWDAETSAYDYRHILQEAKPLISSADYAVANLETTFAGGPNYSGYPNFNSPDALADGLLDAGFDLLLTANNHCMDKGFLGLCRTLDVLDETGLAHVGTSRTEEEFENNIAVADVGGISVAFLGFTYGTNGIPLSKDAPYSVNLFNTDYLTTLTSLDEERLLSALDQAKSLDTDLIAVMIHWGIEYKTKQNSYQERVAQFLFDHGADIILGGHPHVLQPMELRTLERDGGERQGFVCYSLGNFISSQVYDLTDTTVILELELTRDNETGITQVTNYTYTPMLMLNRGSGASERFVLLDAHKKLASGEDSGAAKKCQQAVESCRSILGDEHEAEFSVKTS